MMTGSNRGWGVRSAAACLLWACASPAPLAGPVAVTPDAAANATKEGLRINVAPGACAAGVENERRISGQTLGGSAPEQACERLSADNTTIANGANVAFSAGYRVALGAGFRVEQGAVFAASVDTSRVRGGFVRDDTPASEPHYAVRFLMNADSLTMGTEERLVLFDAEDRLGKRWLALILRFDGTDKWLRAAAADGTGTAESAEFQVTPGWQAIELEWRAAPGTADGTVTVLQDGLSRPGLAGLDNAAGRIDSVRWGILRALTSTDDFLDLDEFVSRRAGRISPP